VPRTLPYGTWPSDLTPDLLVSGATGLTELRLDGHRRCWIELRPDEGGRQVVAAEAVAGDDGPNGDAPPGTVELTPPDTNARTRVHEYGGGSYLAAEDVIWFTDFADQRLYRREPGEGPVAITPEPSAPAALRYADLELTPDERWLLAVRERHDGETAEEVSNELVAIPAAGDGEVVVLADGYDFVAAPKVSPAGDRMAYVGWNHPNMPWDDTSLVVADLVEVDGVPRLANPAVLAGAPGMSESVMAPAWSPDGVLHVLRDASGWWNLYRLTDDAPGSAAQWQNLAEVEQDLGAPGWQLGMSLYGFLDDGRVAVVATDRAVMRAGLIDPDEGTLAPLDVPVTSVRSLAVAGQTVSLIGGAPDRPDAVFEVEVPPRDAGEDADADGDVSAVWREVHVSRPLPIGAEWLSQPEVISFPTSDGMTAHALYHRPRHPDVVGPDDERPPLIVTSHGGPTSHVPPRLELGIAYWTSRGFAVVDVNYRGSTGFGRAYREALRGTWGIYDVDDCVAAVQALAGQGEVDADRALIRGGSASGFTTLAALTFHDVFAAGASYFGVADLAALAEETHKFESRYLDRLVGPYPDAAEVYEARSPVHHTDGLSCPVILLQGMLDRIVPPAQAEAMVAAMEAKGVPYAYVTFDDEDHGFRKAENQIRALEAELSFYAQVFGFDRADDVEPVEVVGLTD